MEPAFTFAKAVSGQGAKRRSGLMPTSLRSAEGRLDASGTRQRRRATLISTFTKVAFKLRRPLTDSERLWLSNWHTKTDYFFTHRRLSRGTAFQLCIEMGAKRGHVTDDGLLERRNSQSMPPGRGKLDARA